MQLTAVIHPEEFPPTSHPVPKRGEFFSVSASVLVCLELNSQGFHFFSTFGSQISSALMEKRTLEEVQATLQIAKLKEEDLQTTIHCLSYGDNVSSADYCLVELDDTLCKHIEAGQR